MTIGDRLTDGELYSCPWILGVVVGPIERLEDRLREFFLEADAMVEDREAYCVFAHGDGGDVYLRGLARFAVLDRVRNNVLHQTGDLRPVRHDFYGSYFDIYIGFRLDNRFRQLSERRLDLFSQIEDLQLLLAQDRRGVGHSITSKDGLSVTVTLRLDSDAPSPSAPFGSDTAQYRGRSKGGNAPA